MDRWSYQVKSYTPQEVQMFCVQSPLWQTFRLSLKGVPTQQKLLRLQGWVKERAKCGRATEVQVDNYINALKRGGQLNMKLEVVR